MVRKGEEKGVEGRDERKRSDGWDVMMREGGKGRGKREKEERL